LFFFYFVVPIPIVVTDCCNNKGLGNGRGDLQKATMIAISTMFSIVRINQVIVDVEIAIIVAYCESPSCLFCSKYFPNILLEKVLPLVSLKGIYTKNIINRGILEFL